jgi:hypothetical protein
MVQLSTYVLICSLFLFFFSFLFDICLYTRNESFSPSSISSIAQSPTDIEIVAVYDDTTTRGQSYIYIYIYIYILVLLSLSLFLVDVTPLILSFSLFYSMFILKVWFALYLTTHRCKTKSASILVTFLSFKVINILLGFICKRASHV